MNNDIAEQTEMSLYSARSHTIAAVSEAEGSDDDDELHRDRCSVIHQMEYIPGNSPVQSPAHGPAIPMLPLVNESVSLEMEGNGDNNSAARPGVAGGFTSLHPARTQTL